MKMVLLFKIFILKVNYLVYIICVKNENHDVEKSVENVNKFMIQAKNQVEILFPQTGKFVYVNFS